MHRTMKESQKDYKDLIHRPRHVSSTRKPMSMEDRAAQFSPFAALTGYETAVRETARLTETKTELTEDEKQLLNEKLLMIMEHGERRPWVTLTYFVEDEKKQGGSYASVSGRVKSIDEYSRSVRMEDGHIISVEQIRSIDGPLFGDVFGEE